MNNVYRILAFLHLKICRILSCIANFSQKVMYIEDNKAVLLYNEIY